MSNNEIDTSLGKNKRKISEEDDTVPRKEHAKEYTEKSTDECRGQKQTRKRTGEFCLNGPKLCDNNYLYGSLIDSF